VLCDEKRSYSSRLARGSDFGDSAGTMKFEKIDQIRQEALSEIQQVADTKALYDLKVKYIGKKGQLSLLMREMKSLSAEEKPAFGQKVNEAKTQFEAAYGEREQQLKRKELSAKLASESVDMTLPGPHRTRATKHPIRMVLEEMCDIFVRLGFSVRLGPMIEHDYYNFEALNFPENHPARDMQDTFFIDQKHVLRTHTSPIQIRTMKKEKPPLRILGPGTVFRCDSDISHSPNFNQVEGFLIDKTVSMADLKGTLAYFNKQFFGQELKTRFRPSFFPFTEPSAEVDCQCMNCKGKGCRLCSHTGWVEIGGCGLVHPNVLSGVRIDPKEWQGFAFGMGVERMAVIKYGVQDIRLFNENDVRFLEQFES
jgi:phenylalanyl-tRNA synthetase alpha chain